MYNKRKTDTFYCTAYGAKKRGVASSLQTPRFVLIDSTAIVAGGNPTPWQDRP